MNVVYFSATEVFICDTTNEEAAYEKFFRTRNRNDFRRVASGDHVYVRATSVKLGDMVHGPPKVLVITNLTDLVI